MKIFGPSHLVIASLLLAGVASLGFASAGFAQDASENPVANPATTDQQPKEGAAPAEETPPPPSIQSSLGKYGDPGGIRKFLDSKGINYTFTYIGEVLGNPTGGFKRGATYEGRLEGDVDIDFEKLAGVKGGAFHVSAYQIHGRGLTGNNLLDLFTVSGIEAYPDTKLFELFYEQKFLDDKVALRVGQLSADTEFFLSSTAGLFVNSSFGWPASYANDLPSGGPAYPLATPAVRLKVKPNDHLTVLAAVFNGDPAGVYIPGVNNQIPQLRDVGGTDFRVQDPPLFITEAQIAYNQEKDAKGLPGTVKLGYLHHFEAFQAFNVPPGVTYNYRGNDSLYGIIDQAIYRKPGTDDQGASVFVRISGLPSDRNLIDFYVDGGLSYKGLIPGRSDDTIGVAAAYGRISPDVAAQDIASGAAPLIRDYQAAIEATYQYAVVPGFSLQPDFQYIFHPGAHGVADPRDGLPIRDAAVFGLRATIIY